MATQETFDRAMRRVFVWEGGYANNPADPGGETNFGISKRAYPDVDIRGLTQADARAIYLRDYWYRPGFDKLPDSIAGAVFDFGVNAGPAAAVTELQRALMISGKPVRVDGLLGDITRSAAAAAASDVLIAMFRYRVVSHYLAIVARRSASQVFLDGWLRRACSLD